MEREKTKNVSGIPKDISQAIQQEQFIAKDKKILAYQQLLKGKFAGISISDSEDLEISGYSQMHLQDAMCEFARYLLVYGASLLYGGDLRQGGYTYIFSELAKLYSNRKENTEERIINYFAWPVHLQLTKSQELEWKYKVKLKKLSPAPDTVIDNNKFLSPDTAENRYIWSKSLSYMREEITKACDFRIMMGGTLYNFTGRMPGLLEETLFAIRYKKPVYLVGAFGGTVGTVIHTMMTEGQENVAKKQLFTQPDDPIYLRLLDYIQAHDSTYSVAYEDITKELKEYGIQGLSAVNGLSSEENKRLFVTPHIQEMIYLIVKGIKNLL